MDSRTITALFETFEKGNPHPKTELNYTNSFTLLIAVLLSAQSTDKGVNKATHALFQLADTPYKMLALGEETLLFHIKTIGLYRTKGANILKLCAILINDHKGEVPCDRSALEALPGVGRKTANVILNVAFGQKTMAVDTHIFRVANRLGLAPGKTPREVEDGLLKVIPDQFLYHAHHWLILHGRYICKAQKPDCAHCPVQSFCAFYKKNV